MYYQENVDYVNLLWEDFMFQADNRDISPARKEHMPYLRFTKVIISRFISKDKTISMRNMINLHTIRDDSLLGTLKFVSKTEDYHKYGALIYDEMINQDIKDPKAYKSYLDFATGKATPKKAKKFKKVASPSKKLDTPGVSMSKKKALAKVDRGKGMHLLSEATLLEAAQLKKDLKKSKQDTHMLHASGSGDGVGSQPKVHDESEDQTTGINEGTGTKPGVPDVPNYQSESENKSWGDSDDDNNDNDIDDVSNDKDDDVESDANGDTDEDENPNLNQNDDEEEEYEKEYSMKKEEKEDVEMTDAGPEDVSQENSYEQVEDDAHVTLIATPITQKIEGPMQSSYVSSDFDNQFLNLDNALPINNEVVSMMNVKVHHEEPSTQTPPLLTIPVTVIPKTSTATAPTIPPTIQPISHLPQQSTPNPAPKTEPTTTLIPALLDFLPLFEFDQRVFILEKELSQLKQVDYSAQLLETIKSQILAMVDAQLSTRLEDSIHKAFRSYTEEFEKKAKDEKKRYINLVEKSVKEIIKDEVKTSLTEFELKKILLDKMQKSKSYRAAQQHKELYDGLVKSYKLDKELFESYGQAYSLKRYREDKDKDEDPPAGSDQGHMNQCLRLQTLRCHIIKKVIWNAGKTIDFRPPQTWISKIAQAEKPPLTFDELMSTPIDFSAYVMNNLKIDNLTQEHLVGPAFNLLKGTCRSRVELEYHFEECYKAGPKRQKFYGYTSNMESKHDVFSTKRVIVVTHVKIMKWYDYGYLEEIEVQREDQKLYKFKKGDFPRLNLRDIKDMLLLLVQKKLSKLERDVIFDFGVALWMPETLKSDISNMTSYIAYNNPQGIIYQDKLKRNRLMHWDELYKFSDGTLTYVRSVLHDIASNLRMDYLPKRRWSELERRRSRIMIKAIDQHLFKTRLMRNLEKFVGRRDYGEDFRLLERTI
nr:hypothetical protein [Tanacetum cinerariifolium]